VQTVESLKTQGIHFEKPVIIAKTGWTTDELAAAIIEMNLHQKYDFVTLLIGVNNQYRGRDLENYRHEFHKLLNTAIDYADNRRERVFVVSIPDWGVTPFGSKDTRGEEQIGKEIDLFNAINKEESQKAKVNYIDITPASRKGKADSELIANDGLHPSGKMYQDWADELSKGVKKQLNR
jgi:lysophospholipase L1-like esterase